MEPQMNILLINPDLSLSERYGILAKVGPTTEPLGLAYLAAAIRKAGHKVKIIDAAPLHYKPSDLIREIKKEKYDVIGVTFMTVMYLCAMDIVKSIRNIDKEVKIIVGGPHVTIMPEETLRNNTEIDYAVLGEGEYTVVELLKAIKGNKPNSDVKGIAFFDKEKNKVVITPPRTPESEIDTFPAPARELLPMNLYTPTPTYYQKLPSYIILTTRGCPFRCVYCSKMFGNVIRYHSVERVIEEIHILIKKYGAKEIIFRDDTFTINKQYVTKLCDEMIKQGISKKIKWMCMTRVNLVDEKLLRIMKKAGCWSIHFGVESGSQRILDIIQKDITIEEIKRAFLLTRKVGIKTKAFFMLGLPTETRKESLQTIKFSKELDPDGVQFTITVPYPGTKLFELAKKSGHMKSFKWEDYQTWAGWTNKELVYVSEGRSQEELKELQKRALREFYLRPKVILRSMLHIKSWYILKAYFYGGLALIKSAFSKK
ncbi:B12-binding domain-containing radical SAM protein [Nanoarchaeota archaeon]